jgi:phenylacetate-CoA ligase
MEGLDPPLKEPVALAEVQGERLRRMLDEVLPRNPFYAQKLATTNLKPTDLQTPLDLARLPFTTKAELLDEQAQHPPFGRMLTYPVEHYSRMHQTSGTAGRPLRWLDTPRSWAWMLSCWQLIYETIGLRTDDRLFFAFSFGPFLGFWTAFEAAGQRGNLCLPGGGMSTTTRIRFLLDNQATVVLGTPTYVLHLAEVARQEGIDLAASAVRALIVAGEPGGSVTATRSRIEAVWGARVFDHSGMTEIGPASIECPEYPGGLHILATEYIAEVIDPQSGRPAAAGSVGELVLTNLGRWGSPLLRYRTGDLVHLATQPCRCGRSWLRLEGGILGRTDDMIHLRGNNVYPGALEAVIRGCSEVAEYRVEVDRSGPLTALRIAVEPAAGASGRAVAERVEQAIRDEFLFRASVHPVEPGSLPRFEMKARRVVIR